MATIRENAQTNNVSRKIVEPERFFYVHPAGLEPATYGL